MILNLVYSHIVFFRSHFIFTLLFIYLNGLYFTALVVLAHECGHGAFCRPRWLESSIGFLIHSSMLWPYFAWRETHRIHHRYTNNLDYDTAHLPVNSLTNISIPAPVLFILSPITFWLYILFNAGGVGYKYETSPFHKTNHFSIFNPLFQNEIINSLG